MRRLVLLAVFLLAACGAGGAPGASDNRIDCRAGAAERYARVCSVEAVESDDGRILTIRKADGGFRRLRVTTDGRGVVAADGAERARVVILPDGRIEVEIGGDRFRLPASVRRP